MASRRSRPPRSCDRSTSLVRQPTACRTSRPIPMTSSRNRSTSSSRCWAVSSRRCRWSVARSSRESRSSRPTNRCSPRTDESLSQLARSRGTALRYEASCIAGVPFLGTFERRPLASRVRALTAILNGTSNAILSRIEQGATFEAALSEAQRLGLGRTGSVERHQRARRRREARVAAAAVRASSRHRRRDSATRARDHSSARPARRAAPGRPSQALAHAAWNGSDLHAFVGPAFLAHAIRSARSAAR